MTYTRRIADDELDLLVGGLPAVSLEGMRGVGKTETALQRAEHVVRLDDPDVRQIVSADLAQLQPGPGTIVIDEWQRIPDTWDYVRRAVDAGASPGRFLLTGSTAPDRAPVHTGAGRIVRVRLRPLSLAERFDHEPTVGLGELLSGDRGAIGGKTSIGLADYVEEVVASGLPGLRPLPEELRRRQLGGYLDQAVRHDLLIQGVRMRSPEALRRWLNAYAAATATTASYNAILDAATAGETDKPARSTVEGLREALSQLWLLDPVPAWLPPANLLEQLGQAPKHHLADPALAARLLGLEPDMLLGRRRGRGTVSRPTALLGPLFESLVTLSVRVYGQAHSCRTHHLRLHRGRREIDLILERPDGAVLAIEIKLSTTVADSDVEHLHWLEQRLGDRVLDRVVITTGSRAFRRADGVAVVPAALLGA